MAFGSSRGRFPTADEAPAVPTEGPARLVPSTGAVAVSGRFRFVSLAALSTGGGSMTTAPAPHEVARLNIALRLTFHHYASLLAVETPLAPPDLVENALDLFLGAALARGHIELFRPLVSRIRIGSRLYIPWVHAPPRRPRHPSLYLSPSMSLEWRWSSPPTGRAWAFRRPLSHGS
jgi:hypothetical protein